MMIKNCLESDKAKVLEEVKEKQVVVRDAILKTLSVHTVDELADLELRDELKHGLRAAINEILVKGEVTRLYFTQYVLQ